MATKNEIEYVLSNLVSSRPVEFFEIINETNIGIGYVLKLLYESSSPITAGEISEKMHVSTARVAILLKKMSLKGLINKSPSADDARITMVSLTDEGKSFVKKLIDSAVEALSYTIDNLGMDKMLQYIELSNEIRNTFKSSISTTTKELK